MTPAVRALEAAGVEFGLHEYRHEPGARDFGREAADALGLDHDRVFKTIVVTVSDAGGARREAMAVVPVSARLGLKAVAAALAAKRAELCDPARAETLTGYVVGGISPIGAKRALPTVIDAMCEVFPTVFVSGGRRGLDLELAPADLIALTGAVVADIAV